MRTLKTRELGSGIAGFSDTATALRQAIVKNPYLKVMAWKACTTWPRRFTPRLHHQPPESGSDIPPDISFATYDAGHMVYLPIDGLKSLRPTKPALWTKRSLEPLVVRLKRSSAGHGRRPNESSMPRLLTPPPSNQASSRLCHAVTCSYAIGQLQTLASPQCGPTICRPMQTASVNPHGDGSRATPNVDRSRVS